MNISPDPNSQEPVYLVRNKLQADILLPYPSLDENPKEILYAGCCMLADDRLLKALRGWLEILDTPAQSCKPHLAMDTAVVGDRPTRIDDTLEDFLRACWRCNQGNYIRVQQLTSIASLEATSVLRDIPPGIHARIAIGKLMKELASNNPANWKILSRKRSHTVEYSITPTAPTSISR